MQEKKISQVALTQKSLCLYFYSNFSWFKFGIYLYVQA